MEGGLAFTLPTGHEQAEGRILVVEDDADFRSLLKLILENLNFGVTTAADGLEALELLDGQPFDALLTDLSMPRLDGHQLVRKIRGRVDSLAALPVLVLTGLSPADPLVRDIRTEGRIEIVHKPPNFRELGRRLQEMVSS